jgi:hypothetical protein
MLETISLEEYAKRIGFEDFNEETTLKDIQEYSQEEFDHDVWDYPIDELDHVLNEVHEGCADKLVYVETEFGLRICEL